MSEHTPMPWQASQQDRVLSGPHKEDHANWFIVGEDGTDDGVPVAVFDAEFTGAATEANAHLAAASPELLAVARRWLRVMGDAGSDRCGCRPDESYVCCRCEVVAAIAKAEGKS